MQISVTGQHLEITDSLRDYITSKMDRLERHSDKITYIHVVCTVEKLRQMVEATIDLNGASIFANAEDEDMYAAIDALIDKLDRQLKKHKEKRSDHHRGTSSTIKAAMD